MILVAYIYRALQVKLYKKMNQHQLNWSLNKSILGYFIKNCIAIVALKSSQMFFIWHKKNEIPIKHLVTPVKMVWIIIPLCILIMGLIYQAGKIIHKEWDIH